MGSQINILEYVVKNGDNNIELIIILIDKGAVISESLLKYTTKNSEYEIWKYMINNFGSISKNLYEELIYIIDDTGHLNRQQKKLAYITNEQYSKKISQRASPETEITLFHVLCDIWSLLHIMSGLFMFLVFHTLAKNKGFKRPGLIGSITTLTLHTLYEVKDICHHINGLEGVAKGISGLIYGQEWTYTLRGINGNNSVYNSYADQIFCMIGIFLGLLIANNNSHTKIKISICVFIIGFSLLAAMIAIGPPPNNSGELDDEYVGCLGLMDIVVFLCVTFVFVLAVSIFIIYKNYSIP
jgi:hypothetical protein